MRNLKIILVGFLIFFSVGSFAGIKLGNPHSIIKIDEIYDYQCPHCQKMQPIMQDIMEKNIQVELHPGALINQLSLYQSSAALSIALTGGDFDAINNIFLMGKIHSIEDVNKSLKLAGIDPKSIQKTMHSQDVHDQLLDTISLLKRKNLTSVPVLIVSNTFNKKEVVLTGDQTKYTIMEAVKNVE